MFNLNKKYKRPIIAGIIFLFITASVSAYIEKCCCKVKTTADNSCCAEKPSSGCKQAPKCECGISMPGNLASENKSDVIDDLLKHYISFARKTCVVNLPPENNNLICGNKLLFKSCSVPIFLKDCSFLI